MKKVFLILIMMLTLLSCDQDVVLDPPTNLRYQEETIFWDSVGGATSYTVILNNVEYLVSEPLFDMHDSPNGNYSASVSANIGDSQSPYSETFSFVVNRLFDHPTNIVVQEKIMTWQSVDNAESYVVEVNDVEYPVASNTIDLSFLDENETYELRVKAVFSLGESAYSSIINYLAYFEIVSTYDGIYNINLNYNLLISLEKTYEIEHILYNNDVLDNDDYIVNENFLYLNYELLQDFALGMHKFKLYTSEGVIELMVDIIENTNPQMISSNSVDYLVGHNIELIFEVFDGLFVGLSGHDIEESDYDFEDGILTIYAEYLDDKIAAFEGDTIIFTYQLKAGDHITIGYIFISIPE